MGIFVFRVEFNGHGSIEIGGEKAHRASSLNLLQISIEKLLRYADRLHLQTSIAVRPVDGRSRRVRVREAADTRRPARKLAAAS